MEHLPPEILALELEDRPPVMYPQWVWLAVMILRTPVYIPHQFSLSFGRTDYCLNTYKGLCVQPQNSTGDVVLFMMKALTQLRATFHLHLHHILVPTFRFIPIIPYDAQA